MKAICPRVIKIAGSIIFVVVFILFFPVFSLGVYAGSIGTNVEWRGEWPGVVGGLAGKYSEYGGIKPAPITVVIQVNWQDKIGRILQEAGGFGPVIVRVEGSSGSNAITPDEARSMAEALVPFAGQIHAVEFDNEVNNIQREWSGGTIGSYIAAYNEFASRANGLRIGPAALDPFFANDAVSVAGQFASGLDRIDVLFFNAYESRPREQWEADPGCGLSWEDKRKTACSWQSIADAYGGLGGERILTEFSLHPPDRDTDLVEVRDFIDIVGPQMGVSNITPLIRNPCSSGSGEWLYFVYKGSNSTFMDMNGLQISPESCSSSGEKIEPPTGGIVDFVTQAVNQVLSTIVASLCNPLQDVLDGNVDDWNGRPRGQLCDLFAASQARYTNTCRTDLSEEVTHLRSQTYVPWSKREMIFKKELAGDGEDRSDTIKGIGLSKQSTAESRGMSTNQKWRNLNNYIGGSDLADKELLQKYLDEPDGAYPINKRIKYSSKLALFAPHSANTIEQTRRENIQRAVGGIAQSMGMALYTDSIHDLIACYVTGSRELEFIPPDEQINDGDDDNNQVLEESDVVYRPVRYSEFFCIDPEYQVGFLLPEQKEELCSRLYGPGFAGTGTIAPSSLYGGIIPEKSAAIATSIEWLNNNPNERVSCWDGVFEANPDLTTPEDIFINARSWDDEVVEARAEGRAAPGSLSVWINKRSKQRLEAFGMPQFARSHKLIAEDNQFYDMVMPYSEIEKRRLAGVYEYAPDEYCENEESRGTTGAVDQVSKLDKDDSNNPSMTFKGNYCAEGADCTAGEVEGASTISQGQVLSTADEFVTDMDSRELIATEYVNNKQLETVTAAVGELEEDQMNGFIYRFLPHRLVEEIREEGEMRFPGVVTFESNENIVYVGGKNNPEKYIIPMPRKGEKIYYALERGIHDGVACVHFPGKPCGRNLQTGGGGNGDVVVPPGESEEAQVSYLTYDIPLDDVSCVPSEDSILDAADRMAGTGDYAGSGPYYARMGSGVAGAQNLRNYWQNIVSRSSDLGINPAFALTLWIEESAAGGFSDAHGMGCLSQRGGGFMTAGGSRLATLLQLDCLSTYIHPQSGVPAFRNFMCRYSGEPSRDRDTDYCTEFTNNPNFVNGVRFWYGWLSRGLPESCMPGSDNVGASGQAGNQPESAQGNVEDFPEGPYSLADPASLVSYTDISGRTVMIDRVVLSTLTAFISHAENLGYNIAVYSAHRSDEEQLRLYEACEANRRRDPNYACAAAPPRQSQHRTGRAFDLYIYEDGEYLSMTPLIGVAESFGLTHPFSTDTPHFYVP